MFLIKNSIDINNTSRSHGGSGAVDLAESVVRASELPSNFKYLYDLDMSIEEKIETIAKKIYGADGIELSQDARNKCDLYTKQVDFHLIKNK